MTLYITVAILAIFLGFLLYGTIATQKWHQENKGQTTISETEHFYLHLFYFNPEDKRIFVPKRTGGGFTFNFANPLSVLVLILIVAGIVALIIIE